MSGFIYHTEGIVISAHQWALEFLKAEINCSVQTSDKDSKYFTDVFFHYMLLPTFFLNDMHFLNSILLLFKYYWWCSEVHHQGFCCRRQGGKSCRDLLLTAFNFQGAVLFVKRIPPQVHHASSSGGYSRKEGQKPNTNSGDTSWRQTRWDHLTSLFPQTNIEKKRAVMVWSFCCAVWWTASVSATSSLCTLKAILLWWCCKKEHTVAQ